MPKNIKLSLLTLISLFAVTANGAPMAFSVNSDSGNVLTNDSLYQIDLANGSDTRRGQLFNGIGGRVDTEGLAFAPDGTLWGIDDDSLTLFPINTASGNINFVDEVSLGGIQSGGGNDFGMTFSCDSTLYITSVVTSTLYRLNMNGTSVIIGALGDLGQNISAIAAIGSPTRLYGLGNGQFSNNTTDSPNLYSIDPQTGVASLIGPLGAQADGYSQGGLAFDTAGNLWAITDRSATGNSPANQTSQVLRIDLATGTATLVSTTGEIGFESLAIAPPSACIDDIRIPTLGPAGKLLAIFILLLTGLVVLRRPF